MYEYLDRRYAMALYEVAEAEGKVEKYLADLKEVQRIIDSNREFYEIIKHPQISTIRKKALFRNIFKDAMDEELLSFLLVLIDKDRILHLREKISEYEKIYLKKHNTLRAKVKTVLPMNDMEREALRAKLGKIYGKEIVLEEEIDKDIIGGVFVMVGTDVIDGTLRNRLMEMKKLMLSTD